MLYDCHIQLECLQSLRCVSNSKGDKWPYFLPVQLTCCFTSPSLPPPPPTPPPWLQAGEKLKHIWPERKADEKNGKSSIPVFFMLNTFSRWHILSSPNWLQVHHHTCNGCGILPSAVWLYHTTQHFAWVQYCSLLGVCSYFCCYNYSLCWYCCFFYFFFWWILGCCFWNSTFILLSVVLLHTGQHSTVGFSIMWLYCTLSCINLMVKLNYTTNHRFQRGNIVPDRVYTLMS